MNAVLAIAGTELRIGFRNRWILLSSLILLVFALLLVLLGSAPTGETTVSPLTVVAASLSTLSVYLVPLIALLLSFDAIAGEIDRGTLQLTLASPVSRGQVLIGKFLGHLAVLAVAVVIGYGIAGAAAFVSAGQAGSEGVGDMARLIVTSIVLGATFIAIGYVASASVRQTGTAAALAVAIWLLAVVLYDLALLGGLLASSDGVFARNVFPYLLVANPADAFRVFNMAAIDPGAAATGLAATGDFIPFLPELAILSPLLWAVIALGVSTFILKRVQP